MKNRWLSLLIGLSMSVFGSTSHAAIDLKSWKNYSNLAEQGAICASFAALMESQSLLNEDMGKLWQERRKFSGAVIGKAVMLEFGKDIASKDIEAFIAEYRDWVLSALMASNNSQPADTDQNRLELGQEKMAKLIKTQCALLFQQGDKQIRQKHPELAYLITPAMKKAKDVPVSTDKRVSPSAVNVADAQIPEISTPEISTPETQIQEAIQPKAIKPLEVMSGEQKTAENPEETAEKKSVKSSKPLTLALGGGITFTPTMPKSGKASTANKTAKAPEAELAMKAPAQSTAQSTAPAPVEPKVAPKAKSQIKPKMARMPEAPPTRPSAPKQTPNMPIKIAEAAVAEVNNSTDEASQPQKPRARLSAPVLSPAQQNATSLILPVRMQLPQLAYSDMPDSEQPNSERPNSKQPDRNIYLSFGDFADLAQAEQKMNLLEKRFSKLFSTYNLKIIAHDVLNTNATQKDTPENTAKTAPAYRLQTNASLDVARAEEICTLLWPHNIGCILKASTKS